MAKKKGQQKKASTKKDNARANKSVEKVAEVDSRAAVGSGNLPRRARLPRACKKDGGKCERDAYFSSQGFQVRSVMGDGNCMFRAFSDQMEGKEGNHRFYRDTVLKYITDHRDDFETYHEQDEEKSFDERLKKLAKNGTYGGNECLVAFARVFNRVVYVHQPEEKFVIQLPPCSASDTKGLKQLHLVYSGGNHYDSLRHLDDRFSNQAADVFLNDQKKHEDESRRGHSVDSGDSGVVVEPDEDEETLCQGNTLDADLSSSDDNFVVQGCVDDRPAESFSDENCVPAYVDIGLDMVVSSVDIELNSSIALPFETLPATDVADEDSAISEPEGPPPTKPSSKPTQKKKAKPLTKHQKKTIRKMNKKQEQEDRISAADSVATNSKTVPNVDEICKGVAQLKIISA